MEYILGIDSGGTKYLVKACDLRGNELAEYTGPPAGHYRFPIEEATRRINNSLDECLARFNGRRKDCACLVCGTTGLDSADDQQLINSIYGSLKGFDCPIVCVNDAEIAHFAVTGGVGAVVIAGTGSVAFGRNSKGETTRSGGWPPCIFGDGGSGTWISHRALHHLSLLLDGTVERSILSEMVGGALNIKKAEELIAVCVQIERMEWENPGLAAMVDKAAAQGDKYAADILNEAAGQTFELADSVVKKLKLYEEPSFKVGAWGSAIVKSPMHYKFFKDRFESKYRNVKVLISDTDAAAGACRLGLKRLERRR